MSNEVPDSSAANQETDLSEKAQPQAEPEVKDPDEQGSTQEAEQEPEQATKQGSEQGSEQELEQNSTTPRQETAKEDAAGLKKSPQQGTFHRFVFYALCLSTLLSAADLWYLSSVSTDLLAFLGFGIWGFCALGSLSFLGVYSGIRWLSLRSWPQLPGLTVTQLFTLGLHALGAALTLVFTTMWCVEWSSRHFRQVKYRGLLTGLVNVGVIFLLLITLPLLWKKLEYWRLQLLSKLQQRFTTAGQAQLTTEQAAGAGTTNQRLKTAVLYGLTFFLCWYADEMVIRLIPSFHSVDLRLPHVLLLALWSTLALTALFFARVSKFLSSKKVYPLLGVLLLGWGSALGLNYQMSPEQSLRYHRDTVLSSQILKRLQAWSDRDGDGLAQHWGGGDCNDRNKKIRPGIKDHRREDRNCNQSNHPTAKAVPLVKRQVVANQKGLQQPKNLILLTIDALRYDAYIKAMPRLQAFAKTALQFNQAYSAGAATYWSVPALLGSRPPSHFKMGRDQTPVNEERLLTESLKDQHFHTALFANVTIFFVRGLSQGAYTKNYETSHYTVHGEKPGAAHLTTNLIKHIDRWRAQRLRPQRDRFFVWGHYYDPHDPYFDVPNFPSKNHSAQEKYLAIVRSVDQQIDRLFKALKKRKLLKDTMIVLTADHGDEFYDHGQRFHGKTLYEEMVKVPLLIYSPAYAPAEINQVISHLDVAPTILAHLGLPPERRFMGNSWDQHLRAGIVPSPTSAFFEVLPDSNYQEHLIGMRKGKRKFIYHLHRGAVEYFDLAKDPLEKVNLYNPLTFQGDQDLKTLFQYSEAQLHLLAKGHARVKLPK